MKTYKAVSTADAMMDFVGADTAFRYNVATSCTDTAITQGKIGSILCLFFFTTSGSLALLIFLSSIGILRSQ